MHPLILLKEFLSWKVVKTNLSSLFVLFLSIYMHVLFNQSACCYSICLTISQTRMHLYHAYLPNQTTCHKLWVSNIAGEIEKGLMISFNGRCWKTCKVWKMVKYLYSFTFSKYIAIVGTMKMNKNRLIWKMNFVLIVRMILLF